MTKHIMDTKIKLIKLIEDDNYSIGLAAKELNVSKSIAGRWIKQYEFHGYAGLMMKSHTYTGEFKVGVVKYMHQNHLSMSETSARFGIPSVATLVKWERIYYEEGEQGLYQERRGRSKNNMSNKPKSPKLSAKTEEDLIAEIQRLRAENAYLKKYNTLVQDKRNLKPIKKQK